MPVEAPETAPAVEIKEQIAALRHRGTGLTLLLLGGTYVHGTVSHMPKNVLTFRIENEMGHVEPFEIPYGNIIAVGIYHAKPSRY